jgi:hypothetical protein
MPPGADRMERRFAPRIEQVEPLLRLALLARGGGMHVAAEGAAVDLRGADLHQLHQAFLEPVLERALAVVEPGLHGCRRHMTRSRHDPETEPFRRGSADMTGEAGQK